MRLIDADKLGFTDFEILLCNGDYKEGLKLLLKKIEDAETIYETRFCSSCGKRMENGVCQMRLIDADKLHPDCISNKGGLAISQSQIANAETIEQETGEWIRNENFPYSQFPFKCSKCGYKVENNTNFCPFCGIKMMMK